MGVPKFFRWLSERYPKINQRFGSLPKNDTCERYFGKPPPPPLEAPDPLSTCGLPPPVDRLYLDMNGIIHGCSHNNSTDEDGAEINTSTTSKITRQEIYQNVCYYLDRIVGDIVQPNEMVYMAIDGVAPRAKLNQQRSRRYRSGLEGQIETTIYQAHAQKIAQEEEQRLVEERNLLTNDSLAMEATPFSMDDGFSFVYPPDSIGVSSQSPSNPTSLEEVTPGRFKGKFKASASDDTRIGDEDDDGVFHSNVITPGTPFFQEFTRHLEHFVKFKISTDPKWRHLTIVFSGPNVPGEGEHKIIDFIRNEKKRPDYNPNLRHCIMGQDGDLIMLGLATHEPNLVLLRERVIFNMTKQRMAIAHFGGLDSYLHNAHFEFLHMGVLRDYLAFEFETSNVLSTSVADLEHTIDDFVFMTFFVGNDFLPHMPALDIGDHAFDLLFHAYKLCRKQWIDEGETMPYLTDRGNIISGRRLEEFLSVLGSHEVTYYDKKRQAAPTEAKRIQRIYKKFGMEVNLPDASLVASKEESDRAAYRDMLIKQQMHVMTETSDVGLDSRASENFCYATSKASFSPVMTGTFQPQEDTKEMDDSLASLLGNLLQNSLSGNQGIIAPNTLGIDDQDLKGRYYYDKFQFTPFDKEKHLALRKSYIEGLVWNLKYYYEGCVSWEWFFPYHYGPMISDLVNLDEILKEVSFEGRLGAPLRPFEQLMGCMPPSQARHLPKPYRSFMTDANSPIIDFYPESFVIDMNGKRWPWEAVTLLPFIDSRRLLEASATVDESELSEDEKIRNSFGEAVIFAHDPLHREKLPAIGDTEGFQTIDLCTVKALPWHSSPVVFCPQEKPVLEPKLPSGVQVPLPGYGSLRNAPIESLWRRKIGIDVFSSRSRYITSCLEISNLMPPLPPIEDLAPKLIGSSVYINYPYFLEGFVTAVSNEVMTMRGECKPRLWSPNEAEAWRNIRDGAARQFLTGEGVSGSGGMMIPDDQPITLSVRPFEKIVRMANGQLAKSYAKFEVEVPLIATFWEPKSADPRLNLPSKLEKNRFDIATVGTKKNEPTTAGLSPQVFFFKRLFPPKQTSRTNVQSAILSTNVRSGEATRYYSNSASLSFRGAEDMNLAVTTTSSLKSMYPWYSGSRLIRAPRNAAKINIPSAPTNRAKVVVTGFIILAGLFGGVQGVSCTEHRNIRDYPLKGQTMTTGSVPPRDVIDQACHGGLFLENRGGHFDAHDSCQRGAPPLEFAHGTTTLSFVFQGGIIAAVDSRASLGSFVGSKTTQKVLPVNSHILGTMAGGAADCMHWIRSLESRALLHELAEGSRMTVARASRVLSNALYEGRSKDLSVGTMIMGYDEKGAPRIFYLDNSGKRIEGAMFAVGSGSTFALAILDTEFRHGLSVNEAVALGIKAIRHATFRDAYSGGFINVYLVTKEGWMKVYTEDVARLAPEYRSTNPKVI